MNSGASYLSTQIQTYLQLVKTEAVLKPVIKEHGHLLVFTSTRPGEDKTTTATNTAAAIAEVGKSVLLNSELMTEMVEQALTQYDYVIIDTAPLSVANAATVFGCMAHGLILIVGQGLQRRRILPMSLYH